MNFNNFKKWLLFFLLILLSSLIIYFQKTNLEKRSNIVEILCVTIFAPIEKIFSLSSQNFKDFFYTVFHYRKVTKQICALERKFSLLEKENFLLKEAEIENNKLKEILKLKKINKIQKGEVCQVISRDANSWLEKVNIDKGYEDGIKKNMVVVNPYGLVGKVFKVFKHTSEIRLITFLDMAVPAKIFKCHQNSKENKREIVGIVYGNGKGSLIMKYMDGSADIKPGNLVITSGIGEIFPKGEKIGEIKSILSNEKDLFKSALVLPSVDFNSLDFVWILNE